MGDGDVTEPSGTLSPEEAEALRMKALVEASYRPRVSEVYGVHVPLGERAARLHCLAVLRLVGGGEDDAALGGGSGSGGALMVEVVGVLRVVALVTRLSRGSKCPLSLPKTCDGWWVVGDVCRFGVEALYSSNRCGWRWGGYSTTEV